MENITPDTGRLPPPPGATVPPPPASPLPLAPIPPNFAPPPPAIPVADARWRSLRGLTNALIIMLLLAAAAAVFGIVAYADRVNAIDDLLDRGFEPSVLQHVHDADHLVGVAMAIMLLLALVILVLIIIWTFRAAKNNEALGRLSPRLKPGWAIAGWLIPLANAVIPVLMLQDLWRGSDPSTARQNPNWRANEGSKLVGWFWVALLVSRVQYLGRSTAHLGNNAELRGLRTHDEVAIFAMVVTIVAAVLAIQVLRTIARRQEECLRVQQAAWSARQPEHPDTAGNL
jgi:hypothetical protein